MEESYLRQTRLLDFGSPTIRDLLAARGWSALEPFDRIGQVYNYVRDEIAFGYNRADDIPASEVLKDGYGQCNTKATLLMALLRALNIPCRLHGFTIHKGLQRGVVPELVYAGIRRVTISCKLADRHQSHACQPENQPERAISARATRS